MGSIVYRATKAQAIRDELASVGASSMVLAHRAIGSRLWFLAQAHKGTLAGRVELQDRGAELEALRPLGPATGLVATRDGEDGGAVRCIPGFVEFDDLRGG